MILAIDQGTTGTTVLLLDRRGRLVSRGYEELPQHFPKPGWVEHDPQDILAVTLRVIARALSAGRVRAGALSAIGITNQRETTIMWDRRTGRPVANAVVWQCRRSAPLCEQLRRRGAEPVFACRGYFAHDVKPLFDPVDYIIFDGINAPSAVTRIVLFDGPALGHARERTQRSIQRALEAGNYEWKTVPMGKDGRIQPERGR